MKHQIKEIFLDVETTGLDERKHSVHQLSGQVYINGKLKEEFDFNIKPHEQGFIDVKALEHSNLTVEDVMAYSNRQVQAPKFLKIIRSYVDRYDKTDKFFFCAYNASFDNKFMRKFMSQNGENYFGSYFWSSSIDIMSLAAEHLKGERHKMENFQQGTVAKWLGIEVDETKLHNSLYDIHIMKQIYDKITGK